MRYIYILISLIVFSGSLIAMSSSENEQSSIAKVIQYKGKNDSLIKQIRIYLNRSEPDHSIPMLFEIINNGNTNTDTLILSKILLSEAYRQKREYKKGEEILLSVLKESDISNYNQAYALNRLASIYNEGNLTSGSKYDTVLKCSELSISISDKYGFDNLKYLSFNEVGYVYKRQGDTIKSRYFLEQAYQGFIEQKAYANAITTAINLSDIYSRIGNNSKAKLILEEAIKMGNPDKQKNLYLRLHLQKAQLYKADGEFELAYEQLSRSRKLQQSFYGDRINRQINEMSALYDLQQKEAQIKESEHQNKIHRQKQVFFIIAITILLIILIILVFVFRLRRKYLIQKRELIKSENENLKKDLEFKNKELTLSTMNMIRHSEFVSSLVPDLKALYKLDSNNRKQSILNIVRGISMHNKTELWEDFYKSFSEVNNSFNSNLMDKHPDLSSKERRLCALLKLDMSTKDIASISHTSIRGLETARHRLRKKLKLTGDVNLSNYLQGF